MWWLAAGALAQGWSLRFEGNACHAVTALADGGELRIDLTRWDDLSDHLLLWRPGLAPLWDEPEQGLVTGRTPEEQDADAEDGWGLSWRLGSDASSGNVGFHAMIVDALGHPGPSYRVGVEQDRILAALAGGGSLEVVRRGEVLASVRIPNGRRLAKKLGRCVAQEPR